MQIRDRIKELRRVKASDLVPNQRNWRVHPEAQKMALRAMLEKIGYVGATLAREDKDGVLHLIDGHMRAQDAGDGTVPVLVLDVTQEEADEILATFDPLSAMAESDGVALSKLMSGLKMGDDALALQLRLMAEESERFLLKELSEVDGVGERGPLTVDRPMVKCVLEVEEVALLETAIRATGLANRGHAVAAICKAYMDEKPQGQLNTKTEGLPPRKRPS